MRFRKTNYYQRSTYCYHFADGSIYTLYPLETRSENSNEIIMMNSAYVDKSWIHLLHQADDRCIYSNNKNCKTPYESWEEQIVEEWKAANPDEKLPSKWHLSLDHVIGEEIDSSKLSILSDGFNNSEDANSLALDRLHDLIEAFNTEEKKLYHLFAIDEKSGREIGRLLNMPEASVRRRVQKIRKKISEDKLLKKLWLKS